MPNPQLAAILKPLATPTTDYPGLVAAVTSALAALEVNDYLTVRTKALEAQFIILALGSSASSDGANLQLSINTIEQVMKNVAALEQYYAAKTSNGRTIRVGLYNGGRRGGLASASGSDGTFHE